MKGGHIPERANYIILYTVTDFFSRYGGQTEPLAMANTVYFLWNQFWPYFHACMLVHKREAAQKADLHFAMQCKFLVSKYLFVFKSKWCWLGLSDRNPKASMISSFIVLLCHWFIFYLDYSTHSLQYIPLCHAYSKCTDFKSTVQRQPEAVPKVHSLTQ